MTCHFYSRAEADDYCNEFAPWKHAITETGRDEGGTYYVVEQVRAFTLEEQQQQPFALREPFNDELFDAWYMEEYGLVTGFESESADDTPPDCAADHPPFFHCPL